MPLPATDNDASFQGAAPLAEIQRSVAAVWLLNLVPFLGLGFLSATGVRGLPILFFVWLAEIAWFKSSAMVPLYFLLSVLGTFIVVVRKRKMTVDDLLRPLQDEPAITDPISSRDRQPDQQESDSIRSDLHKDSSEFALSSFDQKLKTAERQLAARSNDDDEDDEAPSFTGAKPESASEAAVFGPDPFPDEVAAPVTAAQANVGAPAASNNAETFAAPVAQATISADTTSGQPAVEPAVAAADKTAFAAVRADSIGDAARLADQLTAKFAAENTGAAAGFLDSAARSEVANLIQRDPTLASADALVQGASNVQVEMPSPDFTPIPGLGDIPGLGLHGCEDSLGVVPSLPSLSGDPLSGLSSPTGYVNQFQVGTATAGGAPAAQPATCPKCGADLNGQFSFCLSCLSPL